MRFPGATTIFLNKNSALFLGGKSGLVMPRSEFFCRDCRVGIKCLEFLRLRLDLVLN